jgi:hypothetical protein
MSLPFAASAAAATPAASIFHLTIEVAARE